MKFHQTNSWPVALTFALALVVQAQSLHAANFVLNASDAITASSFNSGLHWPGGAAPAPNNTYQTAAFLLRTPQNTTPLNFLGTSLEVQAGGTLRHKTAATITITNLILANTAILEMTQPNGVNNATAAGALAGAITLNGTATIRAGIAGDVAGETLIISAMIGGTGGISTAGSTGNLILTGTNIYTGTTTVSAGTLGGFGIISGPVTVSAGGTLAPGGTTNRTLTISNSLTLAGNVNLKINKTGAALTGDLIGGITTLNYGGLLTVTATGDALAVGDSFRLFNATNYVGTFAAFGLPALANGLTWNTGQLSNGVIAVVSGTPAPILYLDPSLPIEMRVTNLIAQLTLTEKAAQLFHKGSVNTRLGIPNYGGWNQCLHGVWHDTKPTTLFPVSIAAAATWDPDLIRAEASAIADEARAYNVTEGKGLIYRAPVINISRNPFWGRIQECYGEDSWLTARMGVSYLEGLQGTNARYLKVAGTLKHFAVNNVEASRTTLSAIVPERWLHEFWLPHWKACAIEGKAQSIMAAYNRINDVHCAVNTNLLTDILRARWGYKGFVVSDLGGINNMINVDHIFPDAPNADAAALSAGCNYDDEEYRDGIATAVANGLVPEAVVDKALALVLRTAFKLGVFDPPALVPYSTIDATAIHSTANQNLSLQVAQASMVLLKNQNNFLPLDKNSLTNIAVIGPLADTFVKGNYYGGTPVNPVTPRQGLLNRAPSAAVNYAVGCGITTASTAPQLDAALQAATNAQVVIMCLGTDGSIEAEGNDREALELPAAQQTLLQNVYAANTNIVLVLLNAGPLAIPWAKTNTPAIIESWYNGEKGGNAIADVIFGDVNPGGKLPYTIYPSSTVAGLPPQTQYDPSQGFTYMFFTNQALFPFGYGLSYTTFSYSNLQFSVSNLTPDKILNLSFNVRNTGARAGDEVAQVYEHNTQTNLVHPIKKLVGFKKVHLLPGEVQTVNLSVSIDQLSHFDEVAAHDFITDSGDYNLFVGSSSEDIRLTGTFALALPAVILPGAPGGLNAVLYSTNVALEWNMASRAATYTMKRATTLNGTYTVIASGLTNLAFTDTNAFLNATNYYVINAVNAAGESVASSVVGILVVPYVAPAIVPVGLTINVVGAQVTLNWNASTNATAYFVKRAVKSTGPFAVIAGGLTATNYVDALTNSSLTYFYQVTATNAGGESLPATGSVKLSQAPASPWLETDVGIVGLAGGSAIDGESRTFTIQGAGATIYAAADGFHFVYLPLTNDCTLIARVVDTMPTSDLADGWDKAGIMFRETLAPDARYCMVMMTSGQGCALQYRTTTGGNTTRAQALGLSCPYWVKLVRAGNLFTAYHSPDGNAWTQLDVPATISFGANSYVGLAVSARNTNLLDTATFDSFALAVEFNDGIPGAWRQQYFGNSPTINNLSCATCDPDGDHFNNLQEYLAGTSPLDAGSMLSIGANLIGSTNLRVGFNSVTNRFYNLECATNLSAGSWQIISSNLAGTGGILQITNAAILLQPQRFYRISARP